MSRPTIPCGISTFEYALDDDLHGGFKDWYKKARGTWNNLMAADDGALEHKFRWEPATGKTAQSDCGASALSAELRAMARRAHDLSRFIAAGNTPSPQRVRNFGKRNLTSCEKKCAQDHALGIRTLPTWCSHADNAVTPSNWNRWPRCWTKRQKNLVGS